MELRLYSDEEAGRIARNFFENEYHDPGIQKWGRLSYWPLGSHSEDATRQSKKFKISIAFSSFFRYTINRC